MWKIGIKRIEISGNFGKLISENENQSKACHLFLKLNYVQLFARCVENRNRINKTSGNFNKLISENENQSKPCHLFQKQNYVQFFVRCVENRNRINKNKWQF